MLLVLAPLVSLSLAGQEHGRTIPLAEEQIDRLNELKAKVDEFITAARDFLKDRTRESVLETKSFSFFKGLRDWWDKDHISICNRSLPLGLFGVALALCSLAGDPGTTAIVVSGAVAGGQPVADALKAALGKKD